MIVPFPCPGFDPGCTFPSLDLPLDVLLTAEEALLGYSFHLEYGFLKPRHLSDGARPGPSFLLARPV